MTLRRCLLLATLAGCGPDKGVQTLDLTDTTLPPPPDETDAASSSPGTTSTSGPPTTTAIEGSSSSITTTSGSMATSADSTGPASTGGGEGSSGGMTLETGVGPSSSSAESSSSDDAGTFILPVDLPPGECDIWADNCPNGQKCMPFDDQGQSWDSLKCVPIVPDPKLIGDPCTVEDNAVSGVDDCEEHTICWGVDQNLDGVCVPMCKGSEQNPVCPPGTACSIFNDGVLILCLSNCDPLDPVACAGGEVCVFSGDSFLCVPDASGLEGQAFDPCQSANGCDPGLACINPDGVAQCDQQEPGCCVKFCDLDLVNQCVAPLECVPWFEEGMAPAGLEDVGVCAAPP